MVGTVSQLHGCIKSGKLASGVSAVTFNEETVLRRNCISVAEKEGKSSTRRHGV